jgi:hypothetical protein
MMENRTGEDESMNVRIIPRLIASVAIGAAMMWLAAAGLDSARAQTPAAADAINRLADPAVLSGASFPGFIGVPNSQLALYAYRSGAWTPIPFQIDEVSITGTYVVSDGGLLDANDELVFMPVDAGVSVTPGVWPADTASRFQPRYAITVTDPLNSGNQAWAYLYRSATLTRSSAS